MIRAIIVSMRPGQWHKNLFVFAATLFTGKILESGPVLMSLSAFLIFCGLSGTVYIINDIADRESDSRRPAKSSRPVASGRLPARAALRAALPMGVVSLGAAWIFPPGFFATAAAYLALMVSYSLFLKRIIIIDAVVVALGFVARLLAGGFSIGVVSSSWSVIMTFFLALFVSLAKRRSEWRQDYPPALLDRLIIASATCVIVSYALFSALSGKDAHLWIAAPFVACGVLRYLFLVFRKGLGAEPAKLAVKDRPLLFNMAAWLAASVWVIYR